MVIGPDELAKKIVESESKRIRQLENKIDEELERKFDRYCLVTLDSNIFTGCKQFTIEALLSKYSNEGWKIEHVSNQRDGDYYKFTVKE
ncbi:MAG: hypothetical protein KKF52_05325 [Nanoarchaeota archaeon]|nr:hypothetical protein [Nanoarchaeota archaeon]MBU4242626.1 hypothetical protein [Nanoarchaeota archaeon]MBU4352802.1 hypothetical protein [Nanoarchaeota archaeon]MCG2719148.1 hypothetical protein [Nanoarchaeota archaeon]